MTRLESNPHVLPLSRLLPSVFGCCSGRERNKRRNAVTQPSLCLFTDDVILLTMLCCGSCTPLLRVTESMSRSVCARTTFAARPLPSQHGTDPGAHCVPTWTVICALSRRRLAVRAPRADHAGRESLVILIRLPVPPPCFSCFS